MKKKTENKRKTTSPIKKKHINTPVKNAGGIIALAFFHRYGWIVVLLLFVGSFNDYALHFLTGGCIIHSAWTFIGYKRKWKHIFCSYQDSYHRKMTPGEIDWDWVEKKDAYGIPLIFLVMGLIGIAAILFL